uniref:AI-2E family transporter n=1 Tax=Spongospora subterranea TaxID=70186 RepID=A0A0H5QQX6_9EUKA|eukprot:CRZ04032.1 hypothetical protein [Spongospora subterranea]
MDLIGGFFDQDASEIIMPNVERPEVTLKLRKEQVRLHKVKQIFNQLLQLCILGMIGTVLYYDLLMVWPHLGALFWAVSCSLLLDRPQQFLLSVRRRIDEKMSNCRRHVLAILTTTYFAIVARSSSIFTAIAWTFVFSALLFFIFGDPRRVVSSVLVSVVVLLITLPIMIMIKTGTDEINGIVTAVHGFVSENHEIKQIFDDFGTSSVYKYVSRYTTSWGWNLPQWDAEAAKLQAASLITWAGQHLAMFVDVSILLVSRTSNAVVAFVTFITFLFYLLTQDPINVHEGLTPFSESDIRGLINSLKQSLIRTFVCSFFIACFHALITYVSFGICGIQFKLILSMLSGVLAIMPIIGSWAIWVPAAIGFAIKASPWRCIVVVVSHLVGDLYVDPAMRSYIPGNSYFVGLSVAMGTFVFGVEGVLVGPLFAGITMTLLDMYRDYTREPIPELPSRFPKRGKGKNVIDRSRRLSEK